ncbi:MAG: histidine phosphatase family protein [Albidovulum sp.]|uniref:histidine phosphatase family protein n=1 Tax=Albidovulum sp. TaxID=1872424 RepID=UPI003C984383
MIIHLVRHGETASNGQSYAGRTDHAMTEAGHRQARLLSETLRHGPIGTVLTSPLRRARDTAAPVASAHGLIPIVAPDLMEFDFGAYEGMSKQATGLRLRKDHLFKPVPGGESLFDLWSRAGRIARRLRALPDQSTDVVVVGHFWSNRLLFGRLMGFEFEPACRNRDYRPECGSAERISLMR